MKRQLRKLYKISMIVIQLSVNNHSGWLLEMGQDYRTH